jgi:hypothetical protein
MKTRNKLFHVVVLVLVGSACLLLSGCFLIGG